MVTKPNMRMYDTISRIRRSGDKTWKFKAMEIMAGNSQMVSLYKILTDDQYKNTAQRIEAFGRAGLGKKSLYYELKSQFKWLKSSPTGKPPALKFTEPQQEEEEEPLVGEEEAVDGD